MSARPVEPHPHGPIATYDQLRVLADDVIDAADRRGNRVRADIVDQEITIRVMCPSVPRGRIVTALAVQVESQDSRAVTLAENRVHHPGIGLCRTADLLVMTEQAYERQDDDFAVFAPDVSVAVEVVSPSNPGNDYVTKLRDHPCIGVPVYAIVDPRDGTVTVHSGPDSASGEPRYRDTPSRYKFGDTVRLGKWSVDTSAFPRYRA
ncbi:Uma2 family endonuclease [Streptomyces sp. CC224B]|uniref:Uma2 family endonuclease n=1 Tax=Streptomyces sp. CC224B TaxID=3044571 RepID=UPI0024A8F835|nr:Uma2 family endonuclease [Streptomyces sp. CC224B]